MATTVTRFGAGVATTSSATIYTVPASTTGIITNITIANTAAYTVTVTMTIGSYSYMSGLQIPANGTVNFDTRVVTITGESTNILASVGGVINYFVSGVAVV